MRAIVLTLIFLVLTFITLQRPWVGILTWSWFSYMAPHRFAFGFAYLFPYVAITACLTILLWTISKEPKRFPWTASTILEIFLCFWMTFTTFFAYSDAAWDYWDRAIKIHIMVFMTLFIMRSRFRLNALVWTIVLSLGFFGVKGGIWAALTGGTGQVLGPENTFINDNNTIALALVMTLPLMRYLHLQATNKLMRWGLAASMMITTFAILSTYSRGGFIALCAVGFMLWLKSRHKMAFALVLLIMAPIMIKAMPAKWKERMHTIENTDENSMDDSAKGRLNAWRFAINLVEHRPIQGGGFRVFISPAFAQYAPDPTSRHDAHSIYFQYLAEHGIPGFLAFVGIGISTMLTAAGVARRARSVPALAWMVDLVKMVQVSLIGFAVGGAFVGLGYFDLSFHLASIVVLCKVILNDTLRWAARREDKDVAVAAAEVEALVPA